MSRFQFVADHLHAFEVKWLCAVVEVARSSFYAWLAGADTRAAKAAADEALADRIRAVHDEDNTYGAPRITAELNDGVPHDVNHPEFHAPSGFCEPADWSVTSWE
ncbi:hypothetical protein MINTM001_04430 [Mycobacterium paraintracellulare]|uniref:IS3 family transposase n=1 Tax=Mycobacterium paraintracellulare TaxID=1138383 RepID=UPI001928BEA4|nr:IS3 family transposase [Mycobacterium paraintracellulare]BCO39304.1 hypothetical protein MINTM001_04430 [Mycobacterium paraintracellulare]